MWLVEPEKSGEGKWKMQKPESRRLKQHHKVEGGAQKLWFNILSSSETSGEECACSAGHMMESGSAFSSDSSSYSRSPSDHSNLLPLTPFSHKELWVGFSVGTLHLSIAPIFSNIITLILEAFRHMCSWTYSNIWPNLLYQRGMMSFQSRPAYVFIARGRAAGSVCTVWLNYQSAAIIRIVAFILHYKEFIS